MGILLNKSKNYVINGAMDYWQRGISFAAIANGTYSADRFVYGKVGTMVHTLSQDTTTVPTIAQSGFVFSSSLRLALTTPQASLGSTDSFGIGHKVEGILAANLSGKTCTISFWIQATLPGTYAFSIRNAAFDRSFVKSFTVNAANTWEKKSITFTHDSSGAWNYSTGIGLNLNWTFACGSSYQAGDNIWSSGNFIGVTGMSNGAAAGNTNFRIAGVQLEEGVSASNFERAGGILPQELQLCQRYFQILNVYRRRISATVIFDGADIVPMRIYPALSNGSMTDNGTLTLNAVSTSPFNSLYFNGTVAATAGGVHQVFGHLDAEL